MHEARLVGGQAHPQYRLVGGRGAFPSVTRGEDRLVGGLRIKVEVRLAGGEPFEIIAVVGGMPSSREGWLEAFHVSEYWLEGRTAAPLGLEEIGSVGSLIRSWSEAIHPVAWL